MLPYKDSCVIKGGETIDQVTGEITKAEVYSGMCDYQSATTNIVNNVTMATKPRIYVPYDNILNLNINQSVEITLSTGRKIKATILDYQYIDFGKARGIKINLNETTY